MRSAVYLLLLAALLAVTLVNPAEVRADITDFYVSWEPGWFVCRVEPSWYPPPMYYGSVPTGPATGEVVVERHSLRDGESFPLPVFPSDGATADLSETFWTVSVDTLSGLEGLGGGVEGRMQHVLVDFTGTQLSVDYYSPQGAEITEFSVVVTVVAVRQAEVTAAEKTSFGAIKRKFR
jgi:hypothetical protein